MTRRLRQWQAEALDALRGTNRGVVQAIMGAGKSIVIAELAARAFKDGGHVVVTCPTQALVRQLADNISSWTGQVVGQWYADEKTLWPITVVCHASLPAYEAAFREKCARQGRWGKPDDRLWIADECHKTECETVLDWTAPDRRIGFTATPWRAGMRETISSFDDLVYSFGADKAYEAGHVVKPTLHHLSECDDLDEAVIEWCKGQDGGGVVNAVDIDDANQFAYRFGAMAVHSRSEHTAEDARAHIRNGGAVVYVNMLAEGFDCPEIMWMAMRRPVKSRVRFAQEVGRGLRACKRLDKTTCHQLDVHDLWNVHSIDWRAALGEADAEPVPALKLDMAIEDAQPAPNERPEITPELLSALRSWIRAERVAAIFDGKVNVTEIKSRHWRSDPCSRKQLAYLDDLLRRISPRSVDASTRRRVRVARAALIDSIGGAPTLRKGDASDLIDVVRGMM